MAGVDDYLTNPDGNSSSTDYVNLPSAPASVAQDAAAPVQPSQPVQPKGGFAANAKMPFGAKGVFGQILGGLADMALHDAGIAPIFTPRIAAAKQADAIAGWDTDPAGSYLKLASIAGVDAADQHLNNMLSGQYKTAETAKASAQAQQAAAVAPYNVQQEKFKAAAPFYNLAASLTDKSSPADAQGIAATIKAGWARNGLDPADLPTDWSPQGLKTWASQAIPAGTQMTAQINSDYKDKRLDQIDQQIGISQQRADQTASHQEAMENLAAQRASRSDPNADLKGQLLQARIDNLKGKNTTQGASASANTNLAIAKANKLNMTKDGTPLPGYRNPHGLVFQGGDPNNRNSWK